MRKGTDISDVTRVIQLGVPDSLSAWLQRAGRAGRRSDLRAEAILLVEASVFQLVTPKKKKKKKNGEQEDAPEETDDPAVEDIDEGEDIDRTQEARDVDAEDASDEIIEAENAPGTTADAPTNIETQGTVPSSNTNKPGNVVFKKTVDPALRAWIETKGCRRDKVDKCFGNPPRTIRKFFPSPAVI